jgi:hypothetical protein
MPDFFTATGPIGKWGLLVAVFLILLAVFSLYVQPDFMVMLTNQMWACF